ncbi:hypothetical protein KEM55_008601 [Ascosphaera atra]|nr:hypothetical protein KEM55_008601 [Ascosphaera atra]
MADSLYDLLVPYFDQNPSQDDGVAHPSSPPPPPPPPPPPSTSQTTANYLARLPTLSLEALQTTEPASLAQAAHRLTID